MAALVQWLSAVLMLMVMTLASPVGATTLQLHWIGENGYSVRGELHYPQPSPANRVEEQGQGETQSVDRLEVSVYDPEGKRLGTYATIRRSKSNNPYLHLTLDPDHQSLINELDIGGAKQLDWYLKGEIGQNMALFSIDANGQEAIVDQGPGIVDIREPFR